jgi:hypothetical protein
MKNAPPGYGGKNYGWDLYWAQGKGVRTGRTKTTNLLS